MNTALLASLEINYITAPPSNFSVVKTFALEKESNSGPSQPVFTATYHFIHSRNNQQQPKGKQGIAYMWTTSLKLYHCTYTHKLTQDYWGKNQLSQE